MTSFIEQELEAKLSLG